MATHSIARDTKATGAAAPLQRQFTVRLPVDVFEDLDAISKVRQARQNKRKARKGARADTVSDILRKLACGFRQKHKDLIPKKAA